MNITCHYRNDPERPLTDPLPELGGRRFIFRLYSGDILHPLDGWPFTNASWFGPIYFRYIWRAFCPWPILPFLAWRYPFTKRGAYIGFKAYGADSYAYKNWMPEDDVYAGSVALQVSIRPMAKLS